ncbi:MAG: protoporphyrinogen oxidase HemJ [Alphaproteobacteria bacterium]|nr:protoporphyrinogen oxidase HemJ [Alphaproteobacteria bacterium]
MHTFFHNIIDIISPGYLWLKALHIIAVICWMAGLFYLPRLFVYHVEAEHDDTKDTLKMMQYKLYKIIMQPSMHLSLLSGILLAMILDTWMSPWFHLKLTALILLVFFHFSLNHYRKELADQGCKRTGRFFRMINEIPTVLLVIIVIAVVVKPF